MSLSPEEEQLAARIGFPEPVVAQIKEQVQVLLAPLRIADQDGKSVPCSGLIFAVPEDQVNAVLFGLRSELRASGYLAFLVHLSHGQGPDRIAVIKAGDSFEILTLMGTHAPNYDLEPDAVLAHLKEWDRLYGIDILGAGHDWVQVAFDSLPSDLPALARDIYEFCPDTLDQGYLVAVEEGYADLGPDHSVIEDFEDDQDQDEEASDAHEHEIALQLLARDVEKTRQLFLWWD